MPVKDEDIIRSIKKGEDTRILQHLYNKILPKINTYICNNSGTKEDAFDIFQDGVMIFYKHVMNGKFQEEYEISGFLYRVCKNLWINKIKRDNKTIRIDDSYDGIDMEEDPLQYIIKREREVEVKRLLSELGEKCRELLQYVFYFHLNTAEICEKMGFANENTLKTKKYKCKQRLLEIVKDSKN